LPGPRIGADRRRPRPHRARTRRRDPADEHPRCRGNRDSIDRGRSWRDHPVPAARTSWSAISGSTRECANPLDTPPVTERSPRPAPDTRGMLVEAAWAASRAPGSLRAFYQRVRARHGTQVATVATARKLTVLCWHLLIKGEDYAFTQPSLLAHKHR